MLTDCIDMLHASRYFMMKLTQRKIFHIEQVLHNPHDDRMTLFEEDESKCPFSIKQKPDCLPIAPGSKYITNDKSSDFMRNKNT